LCLSHTQQLFDPTQKKKKKKKLLKVNFEDEAEQTPQETASQEPGQRDAEPGWFGTVTLVH